MISLDIFEDSFLAHDYKVVKYTNWASRWYHRRWQPQFPLSLPWLVTCPEQLSCQWNIDLGGGGGLWWLSISVKIVSRAIWSKIQRFETKNGGLRQSGSGLLSISVKMMSRTIWSRKRSQSRGPRPKIEEKEKRNYILRRFGDLAIYLWCKCLQNEINGCIQIAWCLQSRTGQYSKTERRVKTGSEQQCCAGELKMGICTQNTMRIHFVCYRSKMIS